MSSIVAYTYVDSPLGQLLLTGSDGKLSGLYFVDQAHAPFDRAWVRQDDAPIFVRAQEQIEQFVAGERENFELPLAMNGTPFQIEVWQQIAKVPFGETISYSELAWRIGRTSKEARAIGTAAGLNPICWIVPCHRVIGKSGALTGYAGGLARKKALLKFEALRAAGRDAILEMIESEPELALT
jgi:methylated-DNA-[protein]-cysteine S-methyltransferase